MQALRTFKGPPEFLFAKSFSNLDPMLFPQLGRTIWLGANHAVGAPASTAWTALGSLRGVVPRRCNSNSVLCEYQNQDTLAIVTLNDAPKLNALTVPMGDRLIDVVEELKTVKINYLCFQHWKLNNIKKDVKVGENL